MSMNKVMVNGRLAFDLELKGAEGKEVVVSKVSVKRNYKPEGEQYYPEDLLSFKVFGGNAKFLTNNFSKGSNIIIEGDLRVDPDWEKDGVPHKGEMYINVTSVYFPEGNTKGGNGGGGEEKETPKKPATKTSGKPTGKKNPFAKV